MATWSENGRVVGIRQLCVRLRTCLYTEPLIRRLAGHGGGVPPSMAQGFSEIVKKVTPGRRQHRRDRR